VYDALVSPRVCRAACRSGARPALLEEEAPAPFEPRCVAALVRVLGGEAAVPLAS
jgi:HD-GYP domain-containing protein (c-di-GMP phosphodiesterase class II)